MSRNSPRESANAPSGSRFGRKIGKKLPPRPHHSSHTVVVYALWRTWCQQRHYPPLGAQHVGRPQLRCRSAADFHKSDTIRHACHAAPTAVHPQLPQALILLLIYLYSFVPEEGGWGHTAPSASPRSVTPACHPYRLAFKLKPKALRWFFDSRYGRRMASGSWVPAHREAAG